MKIASSLVIRVFLAICGGGSLIPQASGQSSPDIIWKTNGHNREVTAISIAPDGSIVASGQRDDGYQGYVRVWQGQSGALLKTFIFSHVEIFSLAFSPDGNYLATVGEGEHGGIARLWQTIDWAFGTGSTGNSMKSVAFSPDSSLWAMISVSGNRLQMFPFLGGPGGGSSDEPPPGLASSLAFSPNARVLVTGNRDGSLTFWDYTNQLSDETIFQRYQWHTAPISSTEFLPAGDLIATASEDSTVKIGRVTDGTIILTLQDSNAIHSMAISPDGKTLFTASTNLKFWRIADGALLQVFDQETSGIGPVAIAANGKCFTYGRSDGTVVLARMPLWVESIARANGAITLNWQGGSGLYQLQQRTNLTQGSWQNVGSPTTALAATNGLGSGSVFYRVQSLPNP